MSSDFIYLQVVLSEIQSNWKKILTGSLLLGVLVYGGSKIFTPLYKAESSFLTFAPRADFSLGGESGSSLQSVVGALMGGGASGGGTDAFMGVLFSRSLAERVVQSEGLVDEIIPDATALLKKKRDEAAKVGVDASKLPSDESLIESAAGILLSKNIVVVKDKRFPVIRIQVQHRKPEVAARIANAYLRELQNFINTNALTAATKHRHFVEDLLKQSKIQSLVSGRNLSQFFEKYRVSDVSAKLDVSLEDLGLKYSKAAPGEGGSTSGQPREKAELSPRFPGLVSKAEKQLPDENIIRGVPQKHVYEYLKTEEEILGSMVSLLSTQYQLAKMQESKEGLSFQILDPASVPSSPSFPRPDRYALLAFFLTAISMSVYFGVKGKRLASNAEAPKALSA